LAGTYHLPHPQFRQGVNVRGIENQPTGGFADSEYGKYAMFNMPIGLALWNDVLFVADSMNHAIRIILPTSEVITITGTGSPGYINGFLSESMFHVPQGVYVFGNELIIIDTGNSLIRRIVLPRYDYDEDMGDYHE